MRIGYGYDSHRFDETRALVLGGVAIPGSPGLKGHSDADALAHAVIDALLGAAALGDIGGHFPDTDPRWAGADSMLLLSQVVDEIHRAGHSISNIDATVICERPRLSPHIPAIRARLADAQRIEAARVSVKGKTNEGMGPIGAGEGIAVHCVALLEQS